MSFLKPNLGIFCVWWVFGLFFLGGWEWDRGGGRVLFIFYLKFSLDFSVYNIFKQ